MKLPRALWVLVALCACYWAGVAWKTDLLGWDFRSFYIASRIPVRDLYNARVMDQQRQQNGWTEVHPYIRPAVFSLPLVVFRPFSFRAAQMLWAAFALACFAATVWIAVARLGIPPERAWLLAGLFAPAYFSLLSGQDTLPVGFVYALGLLALIRGRDLFAGAVLALTMYKFNLAGFVPLLLVMHRRWRALVPFCLGSAAIFVASFALAPPSNYLELLMHVRDRIGFSGTWVLGLRGASLTLGFPWLYPLAGSAVAIAAVCTIPRVPVESGFTIGMLATILLSPHALLHDASVSFVPLILGTRHRSAKVRWCSVAALIAVPVWLGFQSMSAMSVVYSALYLAVIAAHASSAFAPSRREIACGAAA